MCTYFSFRWFCFPCPLSTWQVSILPSRFSSLLTSFGSLSYSCGPCTDSYFHWNTDHLSLHELYVSRGKTLSAHLWTSEKLLYCMTCGRHSRKWTEGRKGTGGWGRCTEIGWAGIGVRGSQTSDFTILSLEFTSYINSSSPRVSSAPQIRCSYISRKLSFSFKLLAQENLSL